MRYEQLNVGELNVDSLIGGGVPVVGKGDKWFVDGTSGSNGNSGKSRSSALKTIEAGESALVASQNDILYVEPGAYLLTAELAWDKAWTHMCGLGGPNIGGDWSEPNVCLYTTGVAVASTITISGQNTRFANLNIQNYGANAACLTALTIDIYGCYFKNVGIAGNMTSEQNAVVAAASLYIGAAGMYPLFEDCYIGQDVWGVRAAANSGVIRFNDTGGRPNGGWFRRCRIVSTGSTVTCAMVAIPAATSSGRGWNFEDCTFQHFNDAGVSLNQAFYSVGASVQKHSMILKDCAAYGIDEWQDADDDVVISNMPVATVGGGLHIEPTATVS